VIIAAADAAGTLPETLDSIEAQDYQGHVEIVVAAADAPTMSAVRSPGIIAVESPSGRTPVGLNLAASRSTGEILVRVDAHATLPPDYISRVVAVLDATGAEVVGGMQVPRGRSFMERAVAAAMSSPFGAGDARYRVGGTAGPTDTVYLGSFRRSVFESHGGYDERFTRHQDYELNHRIQSSGGTVWFDPELAVTYRPRSSVALLARQYFQYGTWKRRFARLHPGSLRPRQWAPPLLALGLAVSLVGSIWWPILLIAPGAYCLALVLIGAVALRRVGPPAMAMPLALAVMHVSWGSGFLFGQTSDE
jgi:succinoglycan biosynthesis protein ExoA